MTPAERQRLAAEPEARAAYDAWRREAADELEAQAAELLRRAGEMRG